MPWREEQKPMLANDKSATGSIGTFKTLTKNAWSNLGQPWSVDYAHFLSNLVTWSLDYAHVHSNLATWSLD